MKLIFLDIDGVLNHELYYRSDDYPKGDEGINWDILQISRKSIELLNKLVEDTGAKVVISSSWRKNRTVDELKLLFNKCGFIGEIIDKTPVLFFGNNDYKYSVPRGCEIKAWLELNKDILNAKIEDVRYVILDDDSDMLYWQRDKFLWCDPYCGITKNTVYKATRILNRK